MRKDITLDADRPHYYSQFWIDVAMGKREIGGQRTAIAEREIEVEPLEEVRPEPPFADTIDEVPELELEAPVVRTPPAPKKPEPKKPEPSRASLSSLADLAKIDMLMRDSAQMDDDTVPDIENAAAAPIEEGAVATDFDLNTGDLEPVEEPVSLDEQLADEDENYEEEEEEDEWGSGGPRRGSKPNKRRREPRREF
jgi:hypothetical protein